MELNACGIIVSLNSPNTSTLELFGDKRTQIPSKHFI